MHENVSKHMVSAPSNLLQGTPLLSAMEMIEKRNVTTLIVVSTGGELLGVVAPHELVQAYCTMMRCNSNSLEQTVVQRTEELKNDNHKLASLSMIDPLTRLGNRRAMEVDIIRIHASGIRHRRIYSTALFDIDYFKKYNDYYGHQAGDNILQLVANHFQKCIQDTDSFYRYGGEEFLMIMPETNQEEAFLSVERIIDGLANLHIPHVESPFSFITLSAGVASSCHQGQRLAKWRQVVKLADEGLYMAKASGRNQVLISEQSILETIK